MPSYGRRQIVDGPSLEEAHYAAQSKAGARKGALSGPAIGAIGVQIGNAIDDAQKDRDAKKAELGSEITDGPTEEFALDSLKQQIGPVNEAGVDGEIARNELEAFAALDEADALEEELFDEEFNIPEVTKKDVTPKDMYGDQPFVFGQADQGYSQPRGDWQGPLTHPTGPVHNIDQGTLASEQSAGRGRGRTRAKAERVHGRSPHKRHSPFKRYSPLKALEEEIIGQGYRQRASAPSYLGEVGQAAAEGYNLAIDRHNYKQAVWDKQQKDLSEQFAKLEVAPVGISSLDAAKETMGREWKAEIVNLYKNKGNIPPEEYAARVQEINGYSKQVKGAFEKLRGVISDYGADKDSISLSTNPENIDLIDTFYNGGEGLTIQNVDGIPTVVGSTNSGRNVSIPISAIASGSNLPKYNKKVPVADSIFKLAEGVNKIKTDFQTSGGGIVRQNVGWDMVEGSINEKLDTMLENDATVRAIAAERLGVDYDMYEELLAQGIDPKEKVKTYLREAVRELTEPQRQTQEIRQRDFAPQRASTRGSVQERQAARTNQFLEQNDYNTPEGKTAIDSQLAAKGYRVVEHPKEPGTMIVVKGNKAISRVDPNNPNTTFAPLLGVGPGQGSPVKRRSPLRRFADWVMSPFKRDPVTKGEMKAILKAKTKELGSGDKAASWIAQNVPGAYNYDTGVWSEGFNDAWQGKANDPSAPDLGTYKPGTKPRNEQERQAIRQNARQAWNSDAGNFVNTGTRDIAGVQKAIDAGRPKYKSQQQSGGYVSPSGKRYASRGEYLTSPERRKQALEHSRAQGAQSRQRRASQGGGYQQQSGGYTSHGNRVQQVSEAGPQQGPGARWVDDWYSHPETERRFQRYQGGDRTELQSRIAHAGKAGLNVENNPSGRYNAKYDPRNHQITVNEGQGVGAYLSLPHERIHASGIDERVGGQAKEILGTPKTPNKYLEDPREIYSNLSDIRVKLQLKPGQYVTPQMLNKVKNSKQFGEGLFKHYDSEKIRKALNTVADTDRKKERDLTSTYRQQSRYA